VLERLDPTDCTLLARLVKPWLAVALANNLPCARLGAMNIQLMIYIYVY